MSTAHAAAPHLLVAEPPPAYLHRPALVVDCSMLAAVLFREPWCDQAEPQLRGRTLHAPQLLTVEIASVALKKHRRGEVHALPALAHLDTLAMELHSTPSAAVAALALRWQLSAYDACYLWLAEYLRCPLATFDEKLGRAAQQHLAGLGGEV
ncbi:MAG: type II toxin-antitoxin system VapC family toxin [Rhodoferax sp.]